jgi:nucleoside phosphorylase
MKYIVIALVSEAKPLIVYYKLKRIIGVDFYLLGGEDILLCISGIGYDKASNALKQLLSYRKAKIEDVLINIGLCGSPVNNKLGELLLIDKIAYEEETYSLTIDIEHSFKQSKLLSVTEAQTEALEILVDMEAHAILIESLKTMHSKQLLFIKIVSDHFKPESLTKNLAYALINKQIKKIDVLINELQRNQICQQPK